LNKQGLSVVLIVRNEGEILARCLESVQGLADEIVILDSGSSDDTHAVAARFGAKVTVNTDWQGFGLHRQRAQALAEYDWVLMLDADEVVSPALADEIRAAVTADNQNQVYALPRLSYLFGAFIRHGGWYPDYVERLYPRQAAHYNDALVHERLEIPATMKIMRCQHDLLHYTYKNLEHYLVKSAGYAELWARQRLAKGKRSGLFSGIGHGIWCFIRMYGLKAGFLDGRQGLLLALLSAHSTFVKYAALWEKRHSG
jgi:(heptosyl)LPS beta-1,4-glucosyltransferase